MAACAAAPRGALAESPAAQSAGTESAAVDAIFAPYNRPGSPGCALAIAHKGTLLYERGYGYADLDHAVPITPATVFDVGSITKQFTAATILMLAADGDLSLDDDIRTWIPEIPAYERPITIRDLLHHTGGLRDYLNLMPLSGRDYYEPITYQYIADLLGRQAAPVFAAGDRYLYSNSGYMMLALIIERASGETFAQIAQRRIFEPLGMDSSFLYSDRRRIVPHRAIGYTRDDEGQLRLVHNFEFAIPGDGQLYTTVRDLVRWDAFLHGDSPPAYRDIMMTPTVLTDGTEIDYGAGLSFAEVRGLDTVGHGGSSWGFGANLVRFTDARLTIAIECNTENAWPGRMAQRVAEIYLGDAMEPADDLAHAARDRAGKRDAQGPDTFRVNSESLPELAGKYESPELDAFYLLTAQAGQLSLRIRGAGATYALDPTGPDTFVTALPFWASLMKTTLRFQRNGSGTIIGFILDSGSERGLRFTRR